MQGIRVPLSAISDSHLIAALFPMGAGTSLARGIHPLAGRRFLDRHLRTRQHSTSFFSHVTEERDLGGGWLCMHGQLKRGVGIHKTLSRKISLAS